MQEKFSVKGKAGLIALIATSTMLGINLLTEFNFINQLRGIPTFFHNPSTTDSGVSMSMGLTTAIDIISFTPIGLGILVHALVVRKRMPPRRFMIVTLITVAQILIIPGTLSPMIAKALGPNAGGATALKKWDESKATMAFVRAQPAPAGFVAMDETVPQEEVNSRWSFSSKPFLQANIDETCAVVIDYATKLGATNWVEKQTKTKGSVSDPTKTAAACATAMNGYPKLKVQNYTVVSPEFILAGKAIGGAKSPIAFTLTLLKQGTEGEHPHTWVFELLVHTAYNEDPLTLTGGLSEGTIEINDLLQLFGQERLAAPDRNPTDPAFVKEILKAYNHKIPIEVFETKPGVANRLELTNSDNVHMCLSIDPWDAEREGMEDPGSGYGLGFMENLHVLKGFGVAVEGGCKK